MKLHQFICKYWFTKKHHLSDQHFPSKNYKTWKGN